MKKYLLILLAAAVVTACGKSDAELAADRVATARQLILQNQLNQAKIELDSVHVLFPREVPARRIAAHLSDSITYIEAQRTLAYSDSLLNTLLPQVDPLLKNFRYEKNEQYEDNGKYVHRLLRTSSNAARCYLQCYVSDQRQTTLKSYYYGAKKIEHKSLTMEANGAQLTAQGSLHTFQTEGWHEILTLNEEDALQLLNFISANKADRIKVVLQGKSNYIYYLQKNEKDALEQTYLLGILMRDIRQLEQNISTASRQISRFESK